MTERAGEAARERACGGPGDEVPRVRLDWRHEDTGAPLSYHRDGPRNRDARAGRPRRQAAGPAAPRRRTPATGPTGFTAPGPLKFRGQEIARDFGVGYAVASGDVNGDKKRTSSPSAARSSSGSRRRTGRRHVILAAGATTADNVTIAPHDIDGDGRLDIALGAGWTRQNTGTLQWVKQNAPGTTPAWEMFPIAAEPTLHRIKWADVDGDRKLELIVAPLHGKGTTNARRAVPRARLLVFRPPANPKTDAGRWRSRARRITFSTISSR